jgi:hypothetical protein
MTEKREKINYSCLCGMHFGNKKDNYNRHLNKKTPCFGVSPKTSKILHEINKIEPQNNIEIEQEQEQEQENNKLIDTDIDNKLNKILKQNDDLKNENNKLKKQINKTKNTPCTIIQQNNIIINQNIINFNDMDLSTLDKKLFIKPLLNDIGKQKILKTIENIYVNEKYPEYHNFVVTDKNRGYIKIYNDGVWKTYDFNMINILIDNVLNQSKTYIFKLKQNYIIKNIDKIYINITHPWYDKLNIKPKGLLSKFVDIEKEPFNIYNIGEWKTNDNELIDIVISEILTQTINYSIEYKHQNNKVIADTLKTSEKYINFCDVDFLEELKEQQENNEKDNIDLIKRCIEFRNMIYKDTINLLHDNKNKLLKTKNKKNKFIELN